MEEETPELRQLLLDCLKENEPVEPSRLTALLADEWHSLLALVAAQRVRPLFWHRLKQKGLTGVVPVETAKTLQEAFRQNTMRNLRFYGELRTLLTALNAEGIPLILLKGIYLADAAYDNAGIREMNDIDILARLADLGRIADILVGMEYTPLQTISLETSLKTCHHLPPMIKSEHAAFEIHWNITGPDESCSVDPDLLWERPEPVRIAGCNALSLPPEDLLLHICLHTSYHHQFAFGLRPSCDIAAIITRYGAVLDWQAVSDQAIRNGWQRGVYLALRLAQKLVGAQVPVDILGMLCPIDMTETVLATVRAQVFSYKQIATSIPTPFAKLLESRSLLDKLRIFAQRVFVPRAIIAAIYSVPVNSTRIYAYYPYRVFDLLRRHGHNLKKYHQNDAALKSTVGRANVIAEWLATPVPLQNGASLTNTLSP